ELTGGRAFTIDNPNDLADVATKIGIELRNQYVLGYHPNKITRDGKWRKIKGKLMPPKGLPPLRVYARTGYYAPVEYAGLGRVPSSCFSDRWGDWCLCPVRLSGCSFSRTIQTYNSSPGQPAT